MRKLQILGMGCPKCEKLRAVAEEAAQALGLEYEIEKVTEIEKILAFGVMMTPALVVDGEVKVSGEVPSLDEVKDLVR